MKEERKDCMQEGRTVCRTVQRKEGCKEGRKKGLYGGRKDVMHAWDMKDGEKDGRIRRMERR
jgi:hypothetical protein